MHCWARTLFFLVVAVLGIASMIGACGQKGPLYLPEAPVVEEPVPGSSGNAETVAGSDVPTLVVGPPEATAPVQAP